MFALSSFNPAESFFDDFPESPSYSLTPVRPRTSLPVDVKETDAAYRVLVDVPGVSKEDVDVKLEDGVLTVSVTSSEEKEQDDTKVHWRERRFREVKRSFKLPSDLNPEEVSAKQENGVLEIILPKAEEVNKVKKIEVE